MPTYAYLCPSCGHKFEKFHKMSVTKRPACPECRTTTERQITGGAGLVFKGSGFYITDYKKKSKGGEEKPAESGKKAKSGDGKSAPKSDSSSKTTEA